MVYLLGVLSLDEQTHYHEGAADPAESDGKFAVLLFLVRDPSGGCQDPPIRYAPSQ